MRSLIWKEVRENIKWVPLPGLVILLKFLMDRPIEPILNWTNAYFICLTGVIFGLALGFLQVIFEAHGDKRSVLIHRPLTATRVFAAKAIAGVGLYLLALGIPFLAMENWYATPGNLVTPFHWRTSLPWLADILSGLVYYFAGMLAAQREARWYGSRGLALAASFLCSYLVWALPEFWQALLALGIIGVFVAVAAWGSFCTGGSYAPLPGVAKAALGMTMLLGLLILSMIGKQMIGEWLDPGMHYQANVDPHGRIWYSTDQEGRGRIAVVGEDGRAFDLAHERCVGADSTFLDWPSHWGYRHNGRFYVEFNSHTKPGGERWFYDHAQGRLVGYDGYRHNFLGSFGPEGFTPAGQHTEERFQSEFIYLTNRGMFMTSDYVLFPEGIYFVDFVGRSMRKFFTSAMGETVYAARWWKHDEHERQLVVVSTNQFFHIVTEDGQRVVSMPRAFDREKYGPVFVGKLVNPDRYFVWYHLRYWLREPHEYGNEPTHLIEYDAVGRELARRIVPPIPYPAASYAQALYGLVTPMAEVSTLVGASKLVRALERAREAVHKPAVLDYLESSEYYIPGTATMATTLSPAEQPPAGLIPAYIALMLASATACAGRCFVLARRHAFSRARCSGWALIGFAFGWVGLILMYVLQEWPALVTCSRCRKLRVVARGTCEHCGGVQALPPRDGTEVFESTATSPFVALTAR